MFGDAGLRVIEAGGKFCPACETFKTLQNFYADASKNSGYRSYCRSCHSIKRKKYIRENKASILSKNRQYVERNKEWLKDRQAMNSQLKRLLVIEKLGGKCKSCGFDDERALQIDHIDGSGARERKETPDWKTFVSKISKLPTPVLSERYQILCANCNHIKKIVNSEYGDGKKSRRESGKNCSCVTGDRSHCSMHS